MIWKMAFAGIANAATKLLTIFIIALSDTLDRILKDPTRYRPIDENLRTIRMGDYPFNFIYRITSHAIKVYAVAHEKRRPGYWRRRVK